MRYYGWWLIPLLCFVHAEAQSDPEEAAKELRSALRQGLTEALAEDSRASTRQVIEETAKGSGLMAAAVRESLLVMIEQLNEGIGEDGDIDRELEQAATEAQIKAKKGRKLVRGLAGKLRKIVEKDQVYLVGMLVEKEAKKAGLSCEEASGYLRRLVGVLAPEARRGDTEVAGAVGKGVLVVQLGRDGNPFGETKLVPPMAAISAVEKTYLLWNLTREVRDLEIFEEVIMYDPQLVKLHPPTWELTLYGAWYARDLPDSYLRKGYVLWKVPSWGGNISEREMTRKRGLVERFELKELASGKVVTQWYSFCEMEFQEDIRHRPRETFLEKKFRSLLANIVEKEGGSEGARGPESDGGTMGRGESRSSMPDEESAVDQIPPETGLIVEGRSSYGVEKILQREMSRPAENNNYFAYFGSHDEAFIREQVVDIHRSIQPLLLEKIRQSPLYYVRWSSAYRLVYDVLALDAWQNTRGEWSENSSMCMIQIGVKLHHISEDAILFEKNPPLVVTLHKEKPGGQQKLDSLYEDAAGQIVQALDQYWFEEREDR
jgi:hypothetical protein